MTTSQTFERTKPVYTVYSKPACPFCDQAKTLLEQQGLQYDEIVLDVDQPKVEGIQYITKEQLLSKIPHARTMPQIVMNTDTSSVIIGGYSDLKRQLHAA
jgi:glutaredoxin